MFEAFKKLFMKNDFDGIVRSAYGAILKSKNKFDMIYPNDKLHGYALCTDDDVSSLYNVVCTESWVTENCKENESIGYICTEWEQSVEPEVFDKCNEIISRNYTLSHPTDEMWSVARDRRFEALVRALEKARKDGLFDQSTLLLVSSSDASEYMDELSMKAAQRLNLNDLISKYLELNGNQDDE